MQDLVIIGIRGHAVALDRATGRTVWRTAPKGTVVNVAIDGNEVFAATKGEMFCLDLRGGSIRWHNKLAGLGLGIVSVAGAAVATAAAEAERWRRAAAAAAGWETATWSPW